MTQGDRRPERFERGQRLSAAALNMLVDAVLSILNRRIGGGVHKPPNMLVVLDEDLVAAVSWKDNPSVADARVAERRANGNYEVTTRTVIVVNRFENISLDAGTLVGIEWIDGEWQPYKADCTPGSESIPGEGSPGGGSITPGEGSI
jgi:hypothetical protein